MVVPPPPPPGVVAPPQELRQRRRPSEATGPSAQYYSHQQQQEYSQRFRAAQQQRAQERRQAHGGTWFPAAERGGAEALATQAIHTTTSHPAPPRAGPAASTAQSPGQRHQRPSAQYSRWYGILSVLGAVLAVVLAPQDVSSLQDAATKGMVLSADVTHELVTASATSLRDSAHWMMEQLGVDRMPSQAWQGAQSHPPHKQLQQHLPPWLRWMIPEHESSHASLPSDRSKPSVWRSHFQNCWNFAQALVDPSLLHPSASTVTDLLDKVLTSLPRLVAMANLLLACTFYTHAAVADWFLGPYRRSLPHAHRHGAHTEHTDSYHNLQQHQRGLGGYLLFQILLMSAIVAPDILDLLILLSWYTLLGFGRSLAQHCHAATVRQEHGLGSLDGAGSHTHASMLRHGILQLLLLILVGDVLAASLCVALFHGAGWGMVLLLTCDNALLLLDVLGYILMFVAQVWEQQHLERVQECERRMNQINRRMARQWGAESNQGRELPQQGLPEEMQESFTTLGSIGMHLSFRGNLEGSIREVDAEDEEEEEVEDDELEHYVERDWEDLPTLERRLETMEQLQARRLSVLDTTVFVLQLVAQCLTIGHFLHIWMLHGVQFTLIDGVLFLHMYQAVTLASRKIAERQKLSRIARELNVRFDDATEIELRKAAAAGDVCSICLAGMNSTTQVKKVGCGHLYHTQCLQEVVERARSIETARCPLCRANIVDGQQPNVTTSSPTEAGAAVPIRPDVSNHEPMEESGAPAPTTPTATTVAVGGARPNPVIRENERSLFRFSTEDFVPAWLPLPDFSFEVVRRQAPDPAEPVVPPHEPEEPRLSVLRRLLILAGVIPMSAEEEAAALEQLLDMFPQYDRADLTRELRARRSAEAVAERILAGHVRATTRN